QLALDLGSRVASDVSQTEFRPVTHFVGGGPARATAYEGALKLREASHLVSAEGHDVEGILHGPLVSIQPGNVVVLMAQPGPSRERTGEVETALREIGATVLSFAPASDLDEVLAPIVNVEPLQRHHVHDRREHLVQIRSRRERQDRRPDLTKGRLDFARPLAGRAWLGHEDDHVPGLDADKRSVQDALD